MPEEDALYAALTHADDRKQIGYVRHLCERYLKKHPDHAPTLIRYASNLISLAQYSTAQEVLDRAHAVVPNKWLQLVLAQRGHLLQAQGNFPAAEEMFMQAHQSDPNDATYLIYAGSVAFQMGAIDRALTLARQATECSEGCIDEAYFNLGGYFLANRQYREAADCYRKALEIDPNYEIAMERLIDVELILGHQPQPTLKQPPDCVIREATVDDAPSIASLYRELLSDSNVRVLPEQVAAIAGSPGSFLLAVEAGGAVCATTLLNICPDAMYGVQSFGVVENIVVTKTMRGHGIGRLLLAHVEKLAASCRCTKLMLLSSNTRHEAHAFFRRCGFRGDTKRAFVKYRRQFAG